MKRRSDEEISAPLYEYDAAVRSQYGCFAGVDEAGRGPLCGPVCVAACILDPEAPVYGINDSKKLSEKKREALFDQIVEKALAYKIVFVGPDIIDRDNILNATMGGMRQAVEGLDPRCRQTLLTLGASGPQVAWGSLKEARYEIGMVCVTAFGRVITEVGIAMMLGGNIRYETRTMTTAIALETSKGEFAQGIALGLVLLLMAFVVNLALAALRQRDRGGKGGGA